MCCTYLVTFGGVGGSGVGARVGSKVAVPVSLSACRGGRGGALAQRRNGSEPLTMGTLTCKVGLRFE